MDQPTTLVPTSTNIILSIKNGQAKKSEFFFKIMNKSRLPGNRSERKLPKKGINSRFSNEFEISFGDIPPPNSRLATWLYQMKYVTETAKKVNLQNRDELGIRFLNENL